MTKRTVGNAYSDKLFEGPDFSELCNHNGKCEYLNCRFRHYGDNPRDVHKVHSKKRTVRMNIVYKTPLPILATVLYV